MSEADDIAQKLQDKGLPTDDNLDEGSDDLGEEVIVEDDGGEEVLVEEDNTPQGGQAGNVSEEEIAARQSGWKPQEEWDGDPEDWVTAKQFLRNGEYLRKIHNQNRKIKELDTVVGTLAKQQKKIFDAGYEKAKRELKNAYRAASREGDDETAEMIERRMDELETQRQEDLKVLEVKEEQQKQVPQVAPEFASWVQRNDWFVKFPEMRAYAEMEGIQHARQHPEKTNVEIYAFVTNEVRKRFPERFGTMKKQEKKAGSPVTGAGDLTALRKGTGNQVRVSLSAEEKAVGRSLVQRGVYKDMNEYAADLKKMGVKG